jgi:hypothetical protein
MDVTASPPHTPPRDRNVGLRDRLSEAALPDASGVETELQQLVRDRLAGTKPA